MTPKEPGSTFMIPRNKASKLLGNFKVRCYLWSAPWDLISLWPYFPSVPVYFALKPKEENQSKQLHVCCFICSAVAGPEPISATSPAEYISTAAWRPCC